MDSSCHMNRVEKCKTNEILLLQCSGASSDRGGGKRADNSAGWYCKSCNFYNIGYRPVCFACKQVKAGKKAPP
eukprot:6475402-Amphidinium_carterae.1